MIWLSALLTGVLSCLAMPPQNWGWMALVAWIPFLGVWDRSQPLGIKKGIAVGLLLGIVPFLYTHQWMLVLTPWVPIGWLVLIWVLFSLYQSLFLAASIGIVEALRKRFSLPSHMVLPLFLCVWIIFEWTRSLGPAGSTGASLGMAMIHLPAVLQWASIGGIWLLSALVMGMQILAVMSNKKPRIWLLYGYLVVGIVGWGTYRLHTGIPLESTNPDIMISTIQGNHPQMDKLSGKAFEDIMRTYINLTRTASTQGAKIVVWPETVTPYFNLEDPIWVQQIQQLSSDTGITILYGTPIRQSACNYNAIAVVTPTGSCTQRYLKRHLMPFGEYWPMRQTLAQLGLQKVMGTGEYSPGPHTDPIQLSQANIGGAICLESLYPSLIRNSVNSGTDVIVVVANNAWFFSSIAADLHFQQAIMRAVESQRYVVQSANTGISGIITPTGHILAKSKLNERIVLTEHIKTGLPQSIYHRFGDWVIWLSMILLGGLLFFLKKNYGPKGT